MNQKSSFREVPQFVSRALTANILYARRDSARPFSSLQQQLPTYAF
jgi:hypothetical protein